MAAKVPTLIRWEWFKLKPRWLPWLLLLVAIAFTQLFVWNSFDKYRDATSPATALDLTTSILITRITSPDSGVTGNPTTANPATGGPLRSTETFRTSFRCRDVMEGRRPPPPYEMSEQEIEDFHAELDERCERLVTSRIERHVELRTAFTAPFSIVQMLSRSQGFCVFLLAFLATFVVGTEYGSGTVRPVLVRGVGRGRFLMSKLAFLALAAGALLAVLVAVTAASSGIASALVANDGFVLPPVDPPWTDVLKMFGMTWLALLPYIALAVLVTTLTSSAMFGAAIALGYSGAERLLVSALTTSFGQFFPSDARASPLDFPIPHAWWTDFLLGWNVRAWMKDGSTFGVGDVLLIDDDPLDLVFLNPSLLHAFLVICAYTLVLGGVAYWWFRRKDVMGAAGS